MNNLKLMYISDYMYTTGGSHENSVMHLKCLTEVLGENNVVRVALTAGKKIDADDGFIHLQGYNSKVQQLINLLTLNDYCLNKTLERKICELIKVNQVNCVYMNCTMGKLAKAIKKQFPKVVIMSFYHDINAVLLKEWVKEKGIKAIPLCISGKYNEKQMQKYADIHITLNKRDAGLFEKIYGHTSDFELPIILKDKYTQGNTAYKAANKPLEILFAGVYYYPNVQGILWFCNDVLPKIQESVHLNIVGLNMEKLRDKIADPRVTVVGTVDSLAPFYERTDLVIAPIFKGGGMKIKTAEAMMYGKQFIGTSESMEGYSEMIPSNIAGKYIFETNDADGFADAVQMAYENRKQLSNVIPEVRELFEQHFSEDAGIRRFRSLLELAQKEIKA